MQLLLFIYKKNKIQNCIYYYYLKLIKLAYWLLIIYWREIKIISRYQQTSTISIRELPALIQGWGWGRRGVQI